MKRAFCATLLVAATACAPAHASVFGQFTPAQPQAVNSRLFGAYLNASDDATGVLAQLRLSFYENLDFGFQGGLDRIDYGNDKKTNVQLGTDFRFGVMRVSRGAPVDLSIGAAIGLESGDDFSLLTIGPTGVASRTFGSEKFAFSPYLGLVLAFSSADIGDQDETDFAMPLRLGAEVRAIPGVNLCAEAQFRIGDELNDDAGFGIGVNLPF